MYNDFRIHNVKSEEAWLKISKFEFVKQTEFEANHKQTGNIRVVLICCLLLSTIRTSRSNYQNREHAGDLSGTLSH